MGDYLPGNLQRRLKELRKVNGYKSQEQLVEAIGKDLITQSTYSRLESGAVDSINPAVLVRLSDLYNVSTDYILGISDFPEKTYYDIESLGLSMEAAKNLMSGKVDARVINELLINSRFATTTKLMGNYFSNATARVMQTHNSLVEFSYELLSELTEAHNLPNDKDVQATMKKLKEAKIPTSNAELDKISRQLTIVVREIKKKVEGEVSEVAFLTEKLTYEFLETVKSAAADCFTVKDLSLEEKKEIMLDAVVKGISVDESITPERLAELEVYVRQVIPGLIDIWNAN